MSRLLHSVFLFVCLGQAAAAEPPPGIIEVPGTPAPSFELPDLDGAPFRLEERPGHWTFVHFWASWCGPCRREMPALQRLSAHLQDSTLELVLINTAEDEDTIWTFLADVAPELETLMDRTGEVTEAWQPRGLPATYLVDPDGRIQYQALGGRPWDEPAYRRFLSGLLQEPPPER